MKRFIGYIPKIVLFIILYVVIYIVASDNLFIQEQLQFFQNDSFYISENLGYATGPTQMLSEFFVQFSYYKWLGTLIVTLLLMAAIYSLKAILATIARNDASAKSEATATSKATAESKTAPKGKATDKGETTAPSDRKLFGGDIALLLYAIAPIPFFLYPLTTSEGTLPLVQFTIVTAATCGILRITPKWSWLAASIAAPILFYLCGSVAMLLPIFMIIGAIAKGEKRSMLLSLIPLLIYILFGLIGYRLNIVPSCREFLIYKSPKSIEEYAREYESSINIVWYITIFVAILMALLNKIIKRHLITIQIVVSALLIVCSALSLNLLPNKRYAIDADYPMYRDWAHWHYLYQHGEYEKMVAEFDKSGVIKDIVEANYLNLALFRLGRLKSDFFKYNDPYRGNASILSNYAEIPFPSPLLWSEVMGEMGLFSRAQQVAFEGSILSGPRGSAPYMKRVAEIEIMRGNYANAEKLLSRLETTIFYRKWAKEQRKFLNDEAIESDPYYSSCRSCIVESGLHGQASELTHIVNMINHNANYQPMIDIAEITLLARGELPLFADFVDLICQKGLIDPPPFEPLIQDALLMYYDKAPQAWEYLLIDTTRVKEYLELTQAYSNRSVSPITSQQTIAKYRGTLWSYVMERIIYNTQAARAKQQAQQAEQQ